MERPTSIGSSVKGLRSLTLSVKDPVALAVNVVVSTVYVPADNLLTIRELISPPPMSSFEATTLPSVPAPASRNRYVSREDARLIVTSAARVTKL